MEDFSITVSVNSGVVAAFVFFLFEILIFPLILYGTSTLAALTMQRRGKKGESIRVKSIMFPMWGEGLLSGQKSHLLLLVIRIIVIGIPVYMETRLQAREQPLFKTVVLADAFEINPTTNWVKYEKTAEDDIKTLRGNAAIIGERCLDFHEDRWLVARAANLSYLAGRYAYGISCLNGTEKRVLKFRPDDLPPELEDDSKRREPFTPFYLRQNLTLGITVSYGSIDSFSAIFNTTRLQSNMIFRVRNITVLRDSRVQCFSENNFNILENITSVHLKIMCQMKSGDLFLYLTPGAPNRTVNFDFGLQPLVPLKNRTINTAHKEITTRVACPSWVEYMDPPLLTAEHIANIGPDFDLPITGIEFLDLFPRVLFRKKQNRTITIRLNQTKQVTVLDSIFIFGFVTETAFVIVFAVIMFIVARFRLGLEVVPTTLNGLSQCWAHQDSKIKTKGNHVNLSLTHQIAARDSSVSLYYFKNCERKFQANLLCNESVK